MVSLPESWLQGKVCELSDTSGTVMAESDDTATVTRTGLFLCKPLLSSKGAGMDERYHLLNQTVHRAVVSLRGGSFSQR